jgi:ABC-type bacteriocin/lantibiotic exporter with double-glycine peptidase domain
LPIISLLAVCSIRLIPAFNTLSSSFSKRRFQQASLKIVSDALKETPIDSRFEKEVSIKDFDKKIFKENLEFQKVYFSHEGSSNYILQDISLNIKKGHRIGIIGKSGAGKSTLVDLILGLIKPVSGKILIDNKNFEENLIKWQRLIGYVPQDIFLLDDSIKNNIAFGLDKKDINDEKVYECIDLANLTEFINKLPNKENTIVGNRGIKVSGGQKQRIGIARALYNDPKILILDEATSSLDINNETEILGEIFKMSSDKTLIIITHRHNSIFDCDKVYLIDNGKIIDSGSYADIEKRQKIIFKNTTKN